MEWPWPLSSTIKKFNRVDFIKALLYLLLKQKMEDLDFPKLNINS